MAKAFSVVITGDKQIDRNLKKFDDKVRKKVVRKAARNAAKKALSDYKNLVPVNTGSMRDATKVRAMKASRKSRGSLGASIVVDKKKLFALYEARYGHLPGKRRVDKEAFFYPTVVEFGDSDTAADKPLRRAVFGNEAAIKAVFLSELRQAIKAKL